MLLYALKTKNCRTWVLDLAPPPPGSAEGDWPCVYGLWVAQPPALYIGATCDLKARIGRHLSRYRSALKRGRRPASAAATVLAPVLAGRQALLVLRLEAVPDAADLKTVELAWLLVAAGEELPLVRRRGPSLQWAGDPDELRRAFRLARRRQWPARWLTALQPLCQDRSLPLVPWRPPSRRTP